MKHRVVQIKLKYKNETTKKNSLLKKEEEIINHILSTSPERYSGLIFMLKGMYPEVFERFEW